MKSLLITTFTAAAIAIPAVAFAQGAGGAVGGAAGGAAVGGAVGGVPGAVVGGVAGAATGAVLGADVRPRFRTYAQGHRHPSFAYREDLRVGAVLPSAGVTYYDVPAEYNVPRYKYTVVNNRTVLVDPTTRTVVEVID